tara:strand:- start:1128 stop:1256 length:129 start_codon:yes stop_codon:yes gene_type:complete
MAKMASLHAEGVTDEELNAKKDIVLEEPGSDYPEIADSLIVD